MPAFLGVMPRLKPSANWFLLPVAVYPPALVCPAESLLVPRPSGESLLDTTRASLNTLDGL